MISEVVAARRRFHSHRPVAGTGRRVAAVLSLAFLQAALCVTAAEAQAPGPPRRGGPQPAAPKPAEETIHLDFKDVDLSVVIEMIARTTGKNFIYDEKVRGKVTIVSPTPVSLDQAYAVFESVLKVKGFTVIKGPAGVHQIIAVREAKESSIETIKDDRPSEDRDHFVTRLIPLSYIDAEAITSTIKPLVSKEASMVAYPPTNTIILTDTSTNIRRLLTILDAIDVETFKEELAVIKIKHADAGTLGGQISEIYDAEISSAAASSGTAARRARSSRRSASQASTPKPTAARGRVRIITDDRTNSLILLASKTQLMAIRELIHGLDVPVTGGGRIHVYYLKHADSEELAQTLHGLLTGQRTATTRRSGAKAGAAAAAAQPQAIRGQVSALAEGGIQVNADPATNSLVIQASKEAYQTIREVIEKLDIERPQVLVEALIMEVNVNDRSTFGMDLAVEINKAINLVIQSGGGAMFGPPGIIASGANQFLANGRWESDDGETVVQAIVRAAQTDANANIVAAPHLLTSDNEEAEIQIGQNIPIITNRVSSAAGQVSSQSTSVAVERQDVGVTLRVTPQISEGESLRLKIFQENTTVINSVAGDVEEVGVTLAKRNIENTLVVADGQTVVIGGLLSEKYDDQVAKTPFLGDIPILGWMFKTQTKQLEKINLLVFLTPHIIRSPADLERESIRRRRLFEARLGDDYLLSGDATEEEIIAHRGKNPVRTALRQQALRYPLSRMREIEAEAAEEKAQREAEEAAARNPDKYLVSAGIFQDEDTAAEKLTLLLDRGYDATLASSDSGGMVIFELRVGPYDSLREAEDVAEILLEAFGFETAVMLQSPENALPGEATMEVFP